jgi:GNAT superfamily N-acetyltransferase
MAVHYAVSWTYDLRPTLVLKELYVDERARGSGVGKALMTAVIDEGRRIGAARLQWVVLARNDDAKRFYGRFGARHDHVWEPWRLPLGDGACPADADGGS